MLRKSSNIIEGLLFVWKDELLKENKDNIIIPFVLKEDIDNYYRNKKKNIFHLSIQLIISFLRQVVYDFNVNTKDIENYLKNQKNYFLFKDQLVFLYHNNELIASYALKDISIKPTLYEPLIYLYYITCPDLILGNCYVLIEDSLTLKNSFTFLGKPSFEDLEEDEKKSMT